MLDIIDFNVKNFLEFIRNKNESEMKGSLEQPFMTKMLLDRDLDIGRLLFS